MLIRPQQTLPLARILSQLFILKYDFKMYLTNSALMNYSKKKTMCHIIFSIFKLNDKVYTSVTTADQSWPNYIGPKRENPQACLTNPVYALFP